MVHRSHLCRVASWLLIVLASGPGTAMATPAAGAKPAPRAGLPDSVLAVVSGGRKVTISAFRHGWAQLSPPARPDSLTPQTARRFLDLLVGKELLADRVERESWTWTAFESLQVAGLRDRAVMGLALDSAMVRIARARAARGDSALDVQGLGMEARESTVARLGPSYEESLLSRVARQFAALPTPSSDSSLWSRIRDMGRMPVIDPADSARVIAWSSAGPYRVADLTDAWSKLNPLYRPRIETADQVRDLVKNGLFERELRRSAQARHLERDPRVLDAVRRQSEYLDVQYFVRREVSQRIPLDSLTLRRYYDSTRDTWTLPARLRVVRMVLPDRAAAAAMAVRLRDPAQAETLVARGLRQRIRYSGEITAGEDSSLFARALASGTGTVLGPEAVADGWQVMRVNELVPARGRSFDEVEPLVERQWANEEGERRMQALLEQLRRRGPVLIHEAGLARLVREGVPGADSPAAGQR